MAELETNEKATKEALQTHYYKASYDEVKAVYLEFLKAQNHTVVSVNDDYCEIASELGDFCATAKIIMQTPKETSIDLFCSAEGFGSKGKIMKFINACYAAVQAKYELKGLGLHQ